MTFGYGGLATRAVSPRFESRIGRKRVSTRQNRARFLVSCCSSRVFLETLIRMQNIAKRATSLATSLAIVLFSSSAVAAEKTEGRKTFRFAIQEKKTIRKVPTTQVAIRVDEWPDQTFLLWLPESVAPHWGNWKAGMAHQEFTKTTGGGLLWEYATRPDVKIVAKLVPRAHSLLLEVRVQNLANHDAKNIAVQNCFHLSSAEDFACTDFSRIHIQTDGGWKSLRQLAPTVDMPMYYRREFLESGRRDSWGGEFRKYNQTTRVDHPLIVCTSKDGKHAVGTASEDFQCVFHNQLPYLRCIHSQQAPIAVLAAHREAAFRQVIYFVDGGISECESAFRKDVKQGEFRPPHD